MHSQASIVETMLLDSNNPVSWEIFPKVESAIRRFAEGVTDIDLNLYFKQIRNLFVQNSPLLLLGVVLKDGNLDGYVSGVYGPSLSGDTLFIHFVEMRNNIDRLVDIVKQWVDRARKSGIMFSGRINFITMRDGRLWYRIIKKFGGRPSIRTFVSIECGGVV